MTAPDTAVIVTGVEVVTVLVVVVKVALVEPAGTVTLAGTLAAEVLELVRVTATPPDGAAPVSETVPVDGLPPVTLVGLSDTADSVTEPAGFTVSTAVRMIPPRVAVIVTDVDTAGAVVVMGN